jgi:hypothetical protein
MSERLEYERRLRKLLEYVEDAVRSGGRRRVSILVNGDEFGLSADELLLNPRGPIPDPPRRPLAAAPSSRDGGHGREPHPDEGTVSPAKFSERIR